MAFCSASSSSKTGPAAASSHAMRPVPRSGRGAVAVQPPAGVPSISTVAVSIASAVPPETLARGSLSLTWPLTVAVTEQPPEPHLRSAWPLRLYWMPSSTALDSCLVSLSNSFHIAVKSEALSCGRSRVAAPAADAVSA
jgi:hypothetical protein